MTEGLHTMNLIQMMISTIYEISRSYYILQGEVYLFIEIYQLEI